MASACGGYAILIHCKLMLPLFVGFRALVCYAFQFCIHITKEEEEEERERGRFHCLNDIYKLHICILQSLLRFATQSTNKAYNFKGDNL